MVEFGGSLYVGVGNTVDGAQLWYTSDGNNRITSYNVCYTKLLRRDNPSTHVSEIGHCHELLHDSVLVVELLPYG